MSGFEEVSAYGSGDNDEAFFYDSTDDETYIATPEYGYFDGSSFCHQAGGFN